MRLLMRIGHPAMTYQLNADLLWMTNSSRARTIFIILIYTTMTYYIQKMLAEMIIQVSAKWTSKTHPSRACRREDKDMTNVIKQWLFRQGANHSILPPWRASSIMICHSVIVAKPFSCSFWLNTGDKGRSGNEEESGRGCLNFFQEEQNYLFVPALGQLSKTQLKPFRFH